MKDEEEWRENFRNALVNFVAISLPLSIFVKDLRGLKEFPYFRDSQFAKDKF